MYTTEHPIPLPCQMYHGLCHVGAGVSADLVEDHVGVLQGGRHKNHFGPQLLTKGMVE